MDGCAIFDLPADAVSVHLHGVFDNGVTDAAAAINKLIDEIVANGGGTIYFPPSLYVAWRRKEQKYLRYQSAFWGHITDSIRAERDRGRQQPRHSSSPAAARRCTNA
jgi:hypothetical protein